MPRLAGQSVFCYSSSVALVEIDNLTRSYGARRGIEGISFSVPEGSLFGFLGPNGAGKTTTIRVLLGFLRPSGGSARIFGQDCWSHSREIKRDIGYVPGDLRLPAWMNGSTCLSIFGQVRGRDLTESGRDLAGRLDLDLSVKVREMSRGMRQKLGLILALAHSPKLLVLDEPTSALDPLVQEILRELLRERASHGQTVFFSSHSLSEVDELCDRVAIVREGQLVAAESLQTLREKAGHDFTIRWRHESVARALTLPDFMQLTRQDGTVWCGRVAGPIQPMIDFLSGKPIEELSIGRPDLESLFRGFYRKGGAPSA